MCDPLTIGLALTGASAAANAVGANQAARARDKALDAERMRQAQLDREAKVINANARDRYEDFEGQQEDKTSELAQYYTDSPDSAPEAVSDANASAASVMPSTTNDIVTREMDKKSADAKAFTDQQGLALGGLRSFGDIMGGLSRLQARDAGLIGQIGGFKQGSSNVLPYELEDASQKGGGMRFLGDILGAAGSIVTPIGVNAGVMNGTLPGWLSWAGGSAPTTNMAKSTVANAARASSSVPTGYL